MEVGAQELKEGISITAHTSQKGGQKKTEEVGKTAAQGEIEGRPIPLSWDQSTGTGRIEERFLPCKSRAMKNFPALGLEWSAALPTHYTSETPIHRFEGPSVLGQVDSPLSRLILPISTRFPGQAYGSHRSFVLSHH